MTLTAITVRPERASHWYTSDGKPCYSVPMKTKPGETRAPDLRDARKMKLVPSVTTILRCIAKPGLEAWKQTQLLHAALTYPVPKGAQIDDLIQRIIDDSRQESERAADIGSKHHEAIETFLMNPDITAIPPEVPEVTMVAVRSWFDAHVLQWEKIEHCFACAAGYGGRVDFIGKGRPTLGPKVVLDHKTQGTKEGKPFAWYPEWGCQLAGYAYGCGLPKATLVTLAISTTEPGRIEHKVWGDNEVWYATFMQAFAVWKSRLGANFDPTASDLTEQVF